MRKFGTVQQKILLTLLGGAALGMSRNPRQYFRTFRILKKEWKNIDQRNFKRSIKGLSRKKLVKEKIGSDGSFCLALTKEGKKQAKTLNLLNDSINFKKPKLWDGKWRIVMFDIPEKHRIFRSILRQHLKVLKFHKLQQSVFVSPYPFEKPIMELIALYSAQPYVRVVIAIKIDIGAKLEKIFFNKKMKRIIS